MVFDLQEEVGYPGVVLMLHKHMNNSRKGELIQDLNMQMEGKCLDIRRKQQQSGLTQAQKDPAGDFSLKKNAIN